MRMTRLRIYGALTTALTATVIAHVFSQRQQFFTTCIQLTRSNTYLLVLLNFALFVTIIFGRLLQRIFFGHLRALEVEHLYERSWYAITETCLAMTIFRDDFDVQFLALFGSLLFSKIFHWLVQDRVDFMEQGPRPQLGFHIKMTWLMSTLALIDIGMVAYSMDDTLKRGTSMMVIFGFEYTLLATMVFCTFIKYILHTIDLSHAQSWDDKSMYIFYLDLVVDFIKLLVYFLFFGVIVHHTGSLPLHIIRDLYMTVRSFTQRCRDMIQYRRATTNMNERYPNATTEELNATDRVCIICREEMDASLATNPPPPQPHPNLPKKLPCGHIFHFHCLKSWLERQQNCPTCRRSVLEAPPPPQPTPTPAPQAQPAPAAAPAAMDPQAHFMQLWQQQLEHYQQLSRQPPNVTQAPVTTSTPLSVNTTLPWAPSSHLYPMTLTPLVPLSHVTPMMPDANRFMVTQAYDALSDEQLALMEGHYRDAVINRIQAIQQVQDQLSGIVTQLTQILQMMPAVPPQTQAESSGPSTSLSHPSSSS